MRKYYLHTIVFLFSSLFFLFTSCKDEGSAPPVKRSYIITFNTRGGNPPIAPLNVAEGKLAVKPANPRKDGFLFVGWVSDTLTNAWFDFTKPIFLDRTLYARWGEPITVKFETNGGTTLKDTTIGKGSRLAEFISDPTKENKGLIGWYTDKDFKHLFVLGVTEIAEPTTLYARWTSVDCTIDDAGKLTRLPSEEIVDIPRSVRGIKVKKLGIQGTTNIFGDGDDTRVKKVTFPPTITEIDVFAFQKCKALDTVRIPLGVIRIGRNAFSECSALKYAELPPSVTELGNGVFDQCALKEITLPASITSIGSGCFSNCTQLKNVRVEALTPPKLGGKIFDGINTVPTIRVPSRSAGAYENAEVWKNYQIKTY